MSNSNAGVFIISTGGTFEKSYNPVKEIFEFGAGSTIASILSHVKAGWVGIEVLMLVDSLRMDGRDRAKIIECIERNAFCRYVIVHGTSRMIDTAEQLEAHVREKTIVLTGAFYPYRYEPSEGAFNLGFAIAAAQLLDRGVYIAMNGRCISSNKAIKHPDMVEFSIAER